MVPCHHITVANPRLIQILVRTQIQIKPEFKFLKHEKENVQSVANVP